MTPLEILEKAKAFLHTNAWGQVANRQMDKHTPDGHRYCAQGAIVYGAFGGKNWCEEKAIFHHGPCSQERSFPYCANEDFSEEEKEFRPVMDVLDGVAREIAGDWCAGATWYNDALGRTKEEVLALFDRAIDRAKAEHQ